MAINMGEIKKRVEEKEGEFFWKPKTELGMEVSEGEISSMDEIFNSGRKIKEPEIVDRLLPGLQNEVIFIGGSPGKGGGSRSTPTKRTARMHRSGRRYNILAVVAVGNMDGYLGIGKSEGLEHTTAIEKALENAKLNIIPVKRGCGSWECACNEKHSIPFAVQGKSGSVRIELKPAPKGIGLCVNDEAKKLMKMAGIKDIWSKTFGDPRTRINYIFAIFTAFKEMNRMKIKGVEEEIEEKIEEVAEEKEKPKKKEPSALVKERKTKKKDEKEEVKEEKKKVIKKTKKPKKPSRREKEKPVVNEKEKTDASALVEK